MKRWLAGAVLAGTVGCGPATSCVARGARVRTPKGERAIEDLAVGDEVLCVEPTTGAVATARLVAVQRATRECVALRLGDAALTLTSDHPVYCPDTGEWAPAGDWALGHRRHLLRVEAAGVRVVAVQEVSTFDGLHEVFDLTVDHPLHNFVANGVLVHNKSIRATCNDTAGNRVYAGEVCTCADGTTTGYTACDQAGQVVRCEGCPKPDAGTPDAGP